MLSDSIVVNGKSDLYYYIILKNCRWSPSGSRIVKKKKRELRRNFVVVYPKNKKLRKRVRNYPKKANYVENCRRRRYHKKEKRSTSKFCRRIPQEQERDYETS